jgi:hypothetical protein
VSSHDLIRKRTPALLHRLHDQRLLPWPRYLQRDLAVTEEEEPVRRLSRAITTERPPLASDAMSRPSVMPNALVATNDTRPC